MIWSLSERVIEALEQARYLYHRLVLIVGPPGSGKTHALQAVSESLDTVIINVSRELSRLMLDVPERQRPMVTQQLLEDIMREAQASVVLLDNVEILFATSLRTNPIRLLQVVSRHRTVVAALPGTISDGYFIYAKPGHPEYGRYPTGDILVVCS